MSLKSLFRKQRSVGLDVGSGSIKALTAERRGSEIVVVGRGVTALEARSDSQQISGAIHAALAEAGADGEPVVAAIGGPEVVIRQVSLPPLPPAKILPALEIQHRELGLLPPGEAVMDAQVLRRSKDGTSSEILSVSAPKSLIDDRLKLLQQATVTVRILDVEPLALLNGALHLSGLDPGELLVLLTVGRQTSVLCLFSEQGPVVARYLDVGAEAFTEQLRVTFEVSPYSTQPFVQSLPVTEVPRAEAACRELVERMAEDIRLSLTFYRTEYDRESLPRYAIGGWVDLPYVGRWVADRLGLGAPLEVMDPFKAVEVKTPSLSPDLAAAGPQFLQAFGLALRGL
ncbi:MAG: pilus assembly protein PilM [Candidatus Rokubacteria bacterium]|nr:pilus assembly protein PilM [Candidatus Rokubacteria bacterium]